MLDQPLVFLDLETTGAIANHDRITEVGLVAVDAAAAELVKAPTVPAGCTSRRNPGASRCSTSTPTRFSRASSIAAADVT